MPRDPNDFSVMYNYVRSRQLEGTFPGDHRTGCWPITAYRVMAGWGAVLEADWPYSGRAAAWPPTDTMPDLDEKAKSLRLRCYQRVRNIEDARTYLFRNGPFGAAVWITPQWSESPNGLIEMPSASNPTTETHFVSIIGYDDVTRQLQFANSWGAGWGDRGFGVFSYDYFSNYFFEAWTPVDVPSDIPELTPSISDLPTIQLWGIQDASLTTVLHGVDLYDPCTDERQGWAFAVERNGALEIEELYVRPVFRRKHRGTTLLRELVEISDKQNLPLGVWIPHADVSARNLYRADRLLKSAGLARRSSGNRWASFKYDATAKLATTSDPGAASAPSRPGSSLDALGVVLNRK